MDYATIGSTWAGMPRGWGTSATVEPRKDSVQSHYVFKEYCGVMLTTGDGKSVGEGSSAAQEVIAGTQGRAKLMHWYPWECGDGYMWQTPDVLKLEPS